MPPTNFCDSVNVYSALNKKLLSTNLWSFLWRLNTDVHSPFIVAASSWGLVLLSSPTLSLSLALSLKWKEYPCQQLEPMPCYHPCLALLLALILKKNSISISIWEKDITSSDKRKSHHEDNDEIKEVWGVRQKCNLRKWPKQGPDEDKGREEEGYCNFRIKVVLIFIVLVPLSSPFWRGSSIYHLLFHLYFMLYGTIYCGYCWDEDIACFLVLRFMQCCITLSSNI